MSTPLDDRGRWSLELGAGYEWGRLSQDAPAEGILRFPGEPIGAAGERVLFETNVAGPSLWLGVGTRF